MKKYQAQRHPARRNTEVTLNSDLQSAIRIPHLAEAVPFICAGASHAGLVRGNNEDLFYCSAPHGILLVIDGLGGHSGGERAARIALDTIRLRLARDSGSPEERLREALTLANNAICEQAQTAPELAGMGCVVTAAVVGDGHLTIGHVGDTRLYCFHNGRLEKLTRDHSAVGKMEDAYAINELEAMQHPRRHEISRNLGARPRDPDEPEFIDISTHPLPVGAGLLLCSDGLSDVVTAAQMLDALAPCRQHPQQVVKRLIRKALDAGGKDNVTVVWAVRTEQPTTPAGLLEVVAQTRLDSGDAGPALPSRAAPRRARRWLRRLLLLLLLALWTLAAFRAGHYTLSSQ